MSKKIIYLDDAIDALANYIHNMDKVIGTGHLSPYDCKDAATSVLEDLPPAQSERKRGHWKLQKDGNAICSECGFAQVCAWDVEGWDNFCHHCGADMRGEQDE